MKQILISLILVILLAGNASAFDKLTKQDIALESAWLTLQMIDYGQTLSIAKNPLRYHEHNLILGEHPSESEVHLYMIGTAILHPVVTYLLPRKVNVAGFNIPVRTIWQAVSIGVSGTCAISNASIGLRMGF